MTEVVIAPFDITWVTVLRLLVLPVLLPAAIGAINRVTDWPTFVKRLALALLALASSIGAEFLQAFDSGEAYNLWNALFLGVVAYAIAELTYRGFYQAPLKRGEHVALPGNTITNVVAVTTKAGAENIVDQLAAAPAVAAEDTAPPTTIASKIAGN